MMATKLVLLPGLDGTGLLFQPLLEALGAIFPVQVICYPPDQCLSVNDWTVLKRRVRHS